MTQMNLIYKAEADSENEFMVIRVKGGERREWGVDRYTLLYLKYIINKNLLYSPGNSAQFFVIT